MNYNNRPQVLNNNFYYINEQSFDNLEAEYFRAARINQVPKYEFYKISENNLIVHVVKFRCFVRYYVAEFKTEKKTISPLTSVIPEKSFLQTNLLKHLSVIVPKAKQKHNQLTLLL